MGDFQKLAVWRDVKNLAVFIYEVTKQPTFNKDFGLRDQIRKAAVSISSNISEGDESGTNKSSIRYFRIAKASNAEVKNQTNIAYEIGYISDEQKNHIVQTCDKISKQLYRLIEYRSKQ